jgi:hypothetical protein
MIDRLLSPKGADQPFIWFANYGNKEILSEFEDSGKENTFHSIEKNRIEEFGILGRGAKLSHDITTGIFDISGKEVEFLIECKNGDLIPLTRQQGPYNDIITYKSAYSDFNPITNQICSFIDGYFFGYKHNFITKGIEIHSKIIFALPMEDTMRFGIRLVSDKSIVGRLMIIIDGEIITKMNIETKANESTELEWKFVY